MGTALTLSGIVMSQNSPRLSFSVESSDAVRRALQARLTIVEDEILRLAKLASETDDRNLQQKYLDLAQDLQKDA